MPNELFAKAADIDNSAQRDAQQKLHEVSRNVSKQKKAAGEANDLSSGNDKELRDISERPYQTNQWSRGESNPRADTVSSPRLHA